MNKSKLNEHTKHHAFNRVPCAHYSTTVGDKKSLQDHLKVCSKHSGADQLTEEQKKPFKCDYCWHRYMHNKDLRFHMWAKHLDKMSTVPQELKSVPRQLRSVSRQLKYVPRQFIVFRFCFCIMFKQCPDSYVAACQGLIFAPQQFIVALVPHVVFYVPCLLM